PDSARNPHRVPEGLGQDCRGGEREESVLQEGPRVAEGLCGHRRSGEALLLSALLVPGELLLARETVAAHSEEGGGPSEPVLRGEDHPIARSARVGSVIAILWQVHGPATPALARFARD